MYWSINFGLIGKDHAVKNKIKIYTHIYTYKCSLYTCTYDFVLRVTSIYY